MAKIADVKKAQNDWHLPMDQVIDLLNKLGGNFDPLTVQTVKGEDAVSPMNGTTLNAGGGVVRYVQLNGAKLVQIDLMLNVQKGTTFDTAVGQIADDFTPHSTLGWRIFGDENGTLTEVTKDGKLWANGYGLKTWQTVYLHIDK